MVKKINKLDVAGNIIRDPKGQKEEATVSPPAHTPNSCPLASLNSLDETVIGLNPTLLAEGGWESHKSHGPDGPHFCPWPWTSTGNSCPGHTALPSSVHYLVCRRPVHASSSLPQNLPHLLYLPPATWDPQLVPPHLFKALLPQLSPSPLHHQFSLYKIFFNSI